MNITVLLIFRHLLLCELQWRINKLCFEYDTEPYYQALDDKVKVNNLFFDE